MQQLVRSGARVGLLQRGISTKGNLSKDVFERRTSTGSEVFSLLICLDANKFVLLSFSSLIKTIYPRFSTEPLPIDAKSRLPVDVRRSKTLLLKLPKTGAVAPINSCYFINGITEKLKYAYITVGHSVIHG